MNNKQSSAFFCNLESTFPDRILLNRHFVASFSILIFLTVACGGTQNLRIRKNPTTDFQLENKKSVVVLLPSRNFSDHNEIDLRRLDGTLFSRLRSRFKKGRFVTIRQMEGNLLSGHEKETINNFIASFEKSGMLRAEEIQNANNILKVDYFLAPSFGATVGVGFDAEWIFTLSVQIYNAKTGKTAFSITAENSEESAEGFNLQESDFFESVVDSVVNAIP